MAERLAELVSHLLSPGGVAVGVFVGLVPFCGWTSAFVGMAFFAFVPGAALILLLYRGHIPALYLPERSHRDRLLVVGSGCYFVGWLVLGWVQASPIVSAAGALFWVNGLVVWLVNRYWKISIHSVGVAGGAVLLWLGWDTGSWPLLLLIPLVGWARLRLEVHTPAQVVAGALWGTFSAWMLWKLLV